VLDFSRVPEPQLALVDVPVILSRVMKLLEHRFEAQGVAVVSKIDPWLPTILADADQLHEVFLNLAVNALDAMPHGGTLEIEARHRTAEHNGSQRPVVEVSLKDSGCGVRQEDLANVFKPFFTTKQLGKGTGLGLFICRNIVEEHGGWIELTSEPDRGARVTISIPAVPVTMALHSS